MKRILQAMDEVTNKPVEGADSMAKFLRTVTEAEINPPTAPVAPTAPQAPAQPQIDPANYQVPSIDFLKKNNAHPADVINGAQPSSTDPTRIGSWQAGSDFDDLMMALNGSYYQARKANPNYKQPAFVKDDWELVQRMLGTPEGKEYAIANWIGLSDVNDTSPEAQFNRDQHHEFEKQANAKLMQQPDGVITPGWKYDQKLGMTPAQAALQAQKSQSAPVQESMDKFLSIVKKNDVSILNEAANPHKVSLPVQMAMQHYQQAESTTSGEPSLLKKYFHEVESEINEQAKAKRQLVNQYASVIAERVMKKQSKNKVLNEDESDDESERSRFPHYYKHKERTIFRIPDESNPNGYRDIQPESDEWDPIYQQEFPDYPVPKDTGGFYIGNHPLVKGSDNTDEPVGEMATHLRNDPDGHTLIPHGGMGSGKEETWKSVSTRKLQQVIDMINSGNYTGAEHVLYKNGFLEGAVKALARYEEFKTKQGKRPLAKGKELEIGESVMPTIKAKNPTAPKVIKPKAKTSVCKAGQVQTGTQVKDGKTAPKCSVRSVK